MQKHKEATAQYYVREPEIHFFFFENFSLRATFEQVPNGDIATWLAHRGYPCCQVGPKENAKPDITHLVLEKAAAKVLS